MPSATRRPHSTTPARLINLQQNQGPTPNVSAISPRSRSKSASKAEHRAWRRARAFPAILCVRDQHWRVHHQPASYPPPGWEHGLSCDDSHLNHPVSRPDHSPERHRALTSPPIAGFAAYLVLKHPGRGPGSPREGTRVRRRTARGTHGAVLIRPGRMINLRVGPKSTEYFLGEEQISTPAAVARRRVTRCPPGVVSQAALQRCRCRRCRRSQLLLDWFRPVKRSWSLLLS
jgi:hypothetical protein